MMLRQLYSVSSLIFATVFFLLGNGMFVSLLALRGRYEGFSDQMLGLMGSAYFTGYLLGGYIVPRIVRRMGHIRTFAFFAASIAIFVLLHSLVIDIRAWIIIRLLTGISIVGFYTIIESWLNGETQPDTRGQIFAVYMTINMLSNASAQQLLRLSPVESFTLFAIVAIMVCLAMMPVTATRLPQPTVNNIQHLTLRRIWKAAPIAVLGALAAGLTNGTLWTMGALYGKRLGLDTAHVATLMSTIIIGGAALQFPLGHLSDCIDRRKALAIAVGGSAVAAICMATLGGTFRLLLVSAFFYGGMVFAIYSIVIAHLMDRLEPHDMMSGSAGILLLYGIGAVLGPSIAGALMGIGGAPAFPAFFALVMAPLFVYILLNTRRKQQDDIVAEQAQFIPMVRTAAPSVEIAAAVEEHRLGNSTDSATETNAGAEAADTTDNTPPATKTDIPEETAVPDDDATTQGAETAQHPSESPS